MRDVQYEYEAEAKGRTEGLAEGKSKEKLDTAKRLLQMHLSIQDIAKATMLPLAEIKQLHAEMLQPV